MFKNHFTRACGPWLLATALAAPCGCSKPVRLNAPPQGAEDQPPPSADYYNAMTDQALLADMSITDLHFIPHSAEPSGTGVARLQRYAELLSTRGGTLHYDTLIDDDALLARRIESARQVLADTVPDGKRIEVRLGQSQGRGMEAVESIERRKAMLKPPKRTQYGSGGSTGSGSGSGSGSGGGGSGGGQDSPSGGSSGSNE